MTFLLSLLGIRVVVASIFLGRTVLADLLLCSSTVLLISSCYRDVNHSFGSSSMSSGTAHAWCTFVASTRNIPKMDLFTRFHQYFVLSFRSIFRSSWRWFCAYRWHHRHCRRPLSSQVYWGKSQPTPAPYYHYFSPPDSTFHTMGSIALLMLIHTCGVGKLRWTRENLQTPKRTTGVPRRTTADRLRPKVEYLLLRKYTPSVSDDTTERRTYYLPPPSMEEVKGHSKG